jgi:hypothetical protein
MPAITKAALKKTALQRHQNAEQQPAHHRADNLTAPFRWRQIRRERDEVLRCGGKDPDDDMGEQKCGHVLGETRGNECDQKHGELAQDELLLVHHIAERHQTDDPKPITNLGQRDEQPGRVRRRVEFSAEQRQQRLVQINRRHARRRAKGKREDELSCEGFRRRKCHGRGTEKQRVPGKTQGDSAYAPPK